MHRLFFFGATLGVLLFVAPPSSAQQSIPALGQRDAAFVAATPHFRFHSDFWLSLHDYLYGLAGGGPGERVLEAEATDCLAALPTGQVQAWDEAVAFYRAEMSERHPRRDPLVRAVRYRLTNLASEHDPNPELEALIARLRRSASAYRVCLWDEHDARNRARIGGLVAMLARYGPSLANTLGTLYRSSWPESVVVDVVSYSNGVGANTTSGPAEAPHMMLSSLDPDIEGFSGLELVFHEASHIVFGSRHGAVSGALRGAADSLGVEMPRSLWHAVSFHTSGRAVQQVAASAGVNYEPYWFRNNVFPEYHEAIGTHWQPHLNGEATMEEAALALVRALQ